MRRWLIATRDLWVSFIFIILFTGLITAGDLTLTWAPNTEPDLAGYKIYIGTESYQYTTILDVGLVTSYEVSELEDSVRYYFAVSAYDYWSNESALSWEVSAIPAIGEIFPTEITLHPNYPNPFVNRTSIHFKLPTEEPIEVIIYDSLGRLVRKYKRESANRGANIPITWDGKDHTGRDVPSGNYFCRISTSEKTSNIIQLLRLK